MYAYRYRTALVLGPWRPTRREAVEDAVRCRFARWHEQGRDGVEWRFPGEIERGDRSHVPR